MLIKRDVFDKLNAHPAVKSFTNDIGLDPALNIYMKTYFDTAVRENRYYSEDWTFCENWRDIGGQVWVDKRVFLVDMLDKDPSEMGFTNFTHHVQQSQELTFSDLLRYKLEFA